MLKNETQKICQLKTFNILSENPENKTAKNGNKIIKTIGESQMTSIRVLHKLFLLDLSDTLHTFFE